MSSEPVRPAAQASWFALVLLGVGAGLLSGLMGVGGGIVLVPALVMLLHFAQKRAQATSLVAIILTAAAGAISYGIAGEFALLPAGLIAIGGIAGSFVGAEIGHRVSDNQVRVVFAVLMVVVAVRMVWSTGSEGTAGADVAVTLAATFGYVGAGLAMGILSALVGVGGGVILVPLLVLGFAFTPHLAQGTSLLVMIPIAFTGAWRNTRHGYTDWRAGLLVGAGGVAGSPMGSALALALPAVWLQRVFAALLVLVAAQMLWKSWISRRGAPGEAGPEAVVGDPGEGGPGAVAGEPVEHAAEPDPPGPMRHRAADDDPLPPPSHA